MSRPKPVLVTQLFDRHCLEWHPPISICFSQTCLFLLSFSVTLWDWIHEASSIPDICHFFYSSYDLEWSFQCQWWMNIFVDVGLMKTPNEIEFLSCQACRHGLTQLANWQAWQASESSYNCMHTHITFIFFTLPHQYGLIHHHRHHHLLRHHRHLYTG